MAVEFDVVAEDGEVPGGSFGQLHRYLVFGNVHDLLAGDADKVMVQAGVGVVSLAVGIDGQLAQCPGRRSAY